MWALLKLTRLSGLTSPWLKITSWFVRGLYYLNDVHINANSIYMLWAYLYTIFVANLSFQEICSLGIGGSQFVWGLTLVIYHLLYMSRLTSITDNIDAISQSIMDSGLGKEEIFKKIYKEKAKGIPKLAKIFVFLPFVTMSLYVIPVPFTDWLSGNYRSRHPLAIINPFDDKQPVIYEILIYVQATCVSSSSRKTVTDFLFIAMFKSHTAIIQYLASAMESIKKDFVTKRDHENTHVKLAKWVKLHQALIRNIHDLLLVFSPFAIINYVNAVGLVVFGLFVQVKKDNDNFVQSMGIGFFVGIVIVLFFIQTNAAEELISEAQKLSTFVYDVPWYEMKKTEADTIQLVLTITNKPIEVTAYRTIIFVMNRENFAGFLFSSLSAFLTLCQMKDLFD